MQAACPQPSEETAGAGADTKGRDVLVDSIVLLYNTGWDKAYLHYDAGDGWTNTPGVLMDEKYEGYEFYKAITGARAGRGAVRGALAPCDGANALQ